MDVGDSCGEDAEETEEEQGGVEELPWGLDERYSMSDPGEYRQWLLKEYNPWSA